MLRAGFKIFWGSLVSYKKILVPTGQASLSRRTRVPFQRLLDESLICPWLPKMTLPWKQLLLLSIIDCLAGKPPFYMSNDSFMFGHLQLRDEIWRAENHVSVRDDRVDPGLEENSSVLTSIHNTEATLSIFLFTTLREIFDVVSLSYILFICTK